MKKALMFLFATIIGLLTTLFFRTWQLQPQAINLLPPAALPQISVSDSAIHRLAEAIRIPTISYDDTSRTDHAIFEQLLHLMERQFPLCHKQLQHEVLARHSLLFTWQGSNPNKQPMLLMGHTDVVPVANSTNWAIPPFSGQITDGYLNGRGSLDDKNSVWAILESVEMLLRQGYTPQRTVYLAFGHDEEVLGSGAATIVKTLQSRNIRLASVLDEGMVITDGIMPGIAQPVALIGLAEKGYVTLELTAKGTGGHSSMPPPHTAVGMLCRAVADVEANPMPQHIEGAVAEMFRTVAPQMPLSLRLIFSNRWLFDPLLKWQLSQKSSTNATTRTTTAPTMLSGSPKANVLAQEATALINFRILPNETAEDVLRHVEKTVNNSNISVSIFGNYSNPSPTSSSQAADYQYLATTVRQCFPEAIVSPALTIATTDSRQYVPIADNIYRFMPVLLNSDDLDRIHGSNERISVEAYNKSIVFYYSYIVNSQK